MDGPIQMGLSLSGAKEELKRPFSEYALPLGIAFQIQDDILGVFGNEERLGKPIGSDVEEGKITILVAYALEQGSTGERSELRRLLGLGERLSESDLQRFRDIVRLTGAYDRTVALARSRIASGRKALDTITPLLPAEAKEYFSDVAAYMAEREY
jgi:geranylgeranyl diphosphate synthase type I